MTSLCPNCRRPQKAPFSPFCSRRCADVDLQRWLAGVYIVPASEDEAGAEAADEGSGRPGQGDGRPL